LSELESLLDVLPEAAVEDDELGLVEPEDEVEPCGQEQFSAGALDELVLSEVLPLTEGELELLVEDEVPPAALEVVPEPEDWLVCAPCVIVEDGLVVVASWLAVAEPVDTLVSPEPTFTPAPTLAPALTSVLLMPTFASTPTFGFTFTPPEGEVVELEPLAALGCDD